VIKLVADGEGFQNPNLATLRSDGKTFSLGMIRPFIEVFASLWATINLGQASQVTVSLACMIESDIVLKSLSETKQKKRNTCPSNYSAQALTLSSRLIEGRIFLTCRIFRLDHEHRQHG